MSTISGTGVKDLYPGTTGVITVTSRDSSGNLIGTGGDTWIVKITNECTKDNDYSCVGVTGAASTLSSPISGTMTDKGDGTYTYSYTISTLGKVSVSVYLRSSNGCFAEYNASFDFSGTSCGSGVEADISKDYGSGVVACGLSDNISKKITTTILAPYTGTYTFTLTYNDGADVYLDGAKILSQLGIVTSTSQNVNKDLVKDTYYTFYAKWGDKADFAKFQVYWVYGSEDISFLIPTTAQYLALLGGSSPYTISITTVKCGDGTISSTETCDDANTTNGDGCNSSCAVEDNYICNYSTSLSKSVCETCHVSWTPNSSKTVCVPDDITSGIPPFCSFYISMLCIGIFMNFILVKFFKYSSYGMLVMFNHFQMFMLIPLIGAYIPKIVIDFYRFLYGMIFNFWFIFDWQVFINYGKSFGKYSYGYEWYLYLINLQSYSALSNMGKLIWIFMWLVTVFIILGVTWLILRKVAQNTWGYKIVDYLFQFMKDRVFMRLFILSYCFMCLACMTEIGIADNPKDHASSYAFAIIVLLSLIAFLVFSAAMCGISVNQEWYKKLSFAHELFNGMKDDWKFRTFPVVSLLRTMLFVIFVCGAYYKSMYVSLSLMIAVQIIYIIFIPVLRPHLHIKDFVVEIVNEGVLFLGLIFLYLLDRKSRWPDAVSWIYISFIIACVTLYFGITFATIIYEFWKKDKERKRKELMDEIKKVVVADER